MSEHTAPSLIEGAVWRTARKGWRCTAADEATGRWVITGVYDRGHTTTYAPTYEQAAAKAQRMEDRGPYANRQGRYLTITVVPEPNPNHASRAKGCTGDIAPGVRYVEYRGETAAAWESGSRWCAPCGVATWTP